MADTLTLYNYFRSSCSYRVRIALELKNIPYQYEPVHLLKEGGQQNSLDYIKLNPTRLVPTLQKGPFVLTQSLVILEYLDETYPEGPQLFPREGEARYRVKELCEIINSSIQPLTNLGTLQALEKDFSASTENKNEWIANFVHKGFRAFEASLQSLHGTYCLGDDITAADLLLIPQVFSAQRFGVSLVDYPLIEKINAVCLEHAAFQKAHPENQVDSPPRQDQ